MPDPTLEAAYRAALYRIDVGGHWIERRIGVIDVAADAALAGCGCREHWSVLTPCNPGSVALPAADNARRLAQLQGLVRGERYLPAENRAADGSWAEPGLCLLDAGIDRVRELAMHFDQLAFVHAVLGAEPDLIWASSNLK